jgi:hypothetical protein
MVGGGVAVWTMTSEQYIKAKIANVEIKLDKEEQRIPSRCLTSMKSGYRSEIDGSADLKIEGKRYYKELVGILR